MNDNGDKENKASASNIKGFDKCPGCGSAERYFETILNDLKDKGLIDKKIACFDFQLQQGVALPPQRIEGLPFGTDMPAFKRIWDTCYNCGMVYSVHLETLMAKKSLAPAQMITPSRAERRHPERGGFQIDPNKLLFGG